MYKFDCDKDGLIILVEATDLLLERWPGGDAFKQIRIREMNDVLHRALLEAQFIDE